MEKDVAVIVGAGGMGEAIARRISSGRKVLLADFSAPLLDRLRQRFNSDGYDVEVQQVDVSDAASIASLARVASEMGRVQQVVHTAGVSPVQASIDAVLNVDLFGTAFVLEEFGKVISSGGSWLVIASMAGHSAQSMPAEVKRQLASLPASDLGSLPALQPDKFVNSEAAYQFSKYANILRVKAMSRSWGVRGATLNCISPGVISTAMGRAELEGGNGAQIASIVSASATGRIGTPDDIADAAAFLLGPSARFISGADLLVDGGAMAVLGLA